ncbi:MAG TPA: rhodanese-like domain-containing protein [Thermodesulfovibrionia bacterium]|nr:rhodanese-like domain-containing protein [Thermodesulfovibrionia bacterium]
MKNFDEQLTKKYEKYFAGCSGNNMMNALGMVKPDDIVKAIIHKKEEIWFLDIRTSLETDILGMTFKNTLNMPMNEVFKSENLAKIPTDKTVVIICQKGIRALAVATALRNIGFNNVKTLAGGLKNLIDYLCPMVLYNI